MEIGLIKWENSLRWYIYNIIDMFIISICKYENHSLLSLAVKLITTGKKNITILLHTVCTVLKDKKIKRLEHHKIANIL